MTKRKSKNTVKKAVARLSETISVPLKNLFVRDMNVRTIATDDYLDELGEDILRRGQLYPLLIEKELDDNGDKTGRCCVIAGGRRDRALMRLLEKGRIGDDFAVKCEIPDATTGILAEDHSLAENVQRVNLHPVDQFRAFTTLMEKGMSEADIAAACFVSPLIVRQRIKLARVAPELLEDYVAKDMTLEQLEAFAISDDHERQRHVWASVKHLPYGQQPFQIKRHLMETSVRATDRRVRFVGVDTYTAAGGLVTRDLFGDEDDVYLEDVTLLEKLFMEKLESKAEEIRATGWKWVKPLESSQNTERYDYEHYRGTVPELSDDQKAEIEALQAESDALVNNFDNMDDDAASKAEDRYDEITALIEAIQKQVYTDEDKCRCGVFLYVNNGGDLVIEEGLVTDDVQLPLNDDTDAGNDTDELDDYGVALERMQGDSVSEDIANAEEPDAGLSDRLVSGLTQHRTKAARNKLAKNPDVALTLLVCRLLHER